MRRPDIRLHLKGVIKIAFLTLMLSAIPILWGVPPLVDEGPFDFEYKFIPLSLTGNPGCRFAFTYTISMDPERMTKYDKQRTYKITSEFFSRSKNYGSFQTVYSSMKRDETFTYAQFPVKGSLILKYYGGIGAPFFDIEVYGYAVEGDQSTALPAGNKYVQQSSSFTLALPNDGVGILEIVWGVMNGLLKKVGYNNIFRIILVALGITILFFIIRRIIRRRK